MPDYIPKVTIISGEASGDLHGEQLALALRKMLPSVRISGVGGKRMRQAGVELIADSSSWSAIGVAEALGVVPRLLCAMHGLKAYLAKNPPDLLILIDFGFFNLRVAKHVAGSMKVLYYFPPGSWRKNAAYSDLAGRVDRVVTPFSWSAVALRNQGFHVDYFGHPLLDVVHPTLSREVFCKKFGLDMERMIVGMLPGSRAQEIAHNLPALAVTGARMLKSHPDLQFVIPMASSVSINAIRNELNAVPWIEADGCDSDSHTQMRIGALQRLGIAKRAQALARDEGLDLAETRVQIKLLPGMAYDILAHSRAAIVTSGTATVEAAILGCPMAIIYRGSKLTALEYKLRGMNIKFIGMPNIILDRELCPELIQDNATPRAISDVMSKLIADSDERSAMLDGLLQVRSALGDPGAVEKTASVVLEMLDEERVKAG